MTNLVIEIGNTALKAAWADGITLGKTFRYQGERTMDFILSLTARTKPDVMVISTVRDLSGHNVEILRNECTRLILMDSKHQDVSVNWNIPTYLTPDRAASIIASRFLFKGSACTIFDFGTIMTVDFLDRDGVHTGGNITTGCRTRFKAVNRYSRSLPLLDTPVDNVQAGTDVQSSIESGIVSGIMFEIQGYMALHPENVVIFTGGDAIYFAKRMKNSIFVVCNLVLMGLALIADRYEENNS